MKEFTYKGYFCLILEMEHTGHLCGYVKIPKDHPLFEKSYSDDDFPNFNVHGGITFSGTPRTRYGHFIGFDCAHFGDRLPKMPLSIASEGVYRDEGYVTKELERLVDQIIEREP